MEKLKGYIKEEDLKNPLKSTAKDITMNNSKFTSKNVEGALEELFTNVDNGKDSLYSAIIGKKVAPRSKDFKDLTNAVNNIKLGQGNAQSGDVLQGKTFTNDSGVVRNGTMINNGTKIITPSVINQSIPEGFHNGSGYVKGDSNLIAENIKNGINIWGIQGNYSTTEYKENFEFNSHIGLQPYEEIIEKHFPAGDSRGFFLYFYIESKKFSQTRQSSFNYSSMNSYGSCGELTTTIGWDYPKLRIKADIRHSDSKIIFTLQRYYGGKYEYDLDYIRCRYKVAYF